MHGWSPMHVRLKGLNSFTCRLADGVERRPRLSGEPGTPKPIASYNEAVATKVAPVGHHPIQLGQMCARCVHDVFWAPCFFLRKASVSVWNHFGDPGRI